MSTITIDGLTKTFGGNVRAVDELSLTIEDKEFVTLLGPSGCGKSTTLRILSGLEDPTEGDVYFDDEIVSSAGTDIWVPPEKRGVGLVFQSYALWPHMTVWDNVKFGLDMQHVGKAERESRISSTLSLLQIQGLEQRYSYELSGGQQQRVALARSLALQPKVLLLDEPLSNLDARLRIEMRAELKRLHGELHNTVVFVTHDQLEAMTLSTRIAVMRNGHLQQYAPPLTIYRKPANLFVAMFVGSPPINVVAKASAPETFASISTVLSSKVGAAGMEEIAYFAIRPESLRVVSPEDGAAGGWSTRGRVLGVQPTGPEWIIQVEIAGANFFAALHSDPGRIEAGSHCKVVSDTAEIHAFDPSERRVHVGPE